MRSGEKLFCYAIAALFMLFLLAPVVWMLASSFKGALAMFADPPVLIADFTFDNYRQVLSDSQFTRAFLNSVIVSSGTAIISMALAIPASYSLARLQSNARPALVSIILLVRAAPGMIFVIPYFLVYQRTGLMDTRTGLIIINTIFSVPLAIWVLIPFFQSVPLAIEEAARIDGATRMQILTRVAVPIAAPGIVSTAILVFIFAWNEFLFALTLTRFEAKTAPIAILNYMAYEGTEWGKVSAAGVIILLPVAVFAMFIRKYLVRSAAGGVKG